MTAIADLVAHLVSTGCPVDAIARAVELAQQHAIESANVHRTSADSPVDIAAERRRAYDRERQKRRRASTGQSADSPSEPLILSKKDTIEEVREEKQVREEIVEGRKKGTRLPSDFPLSDSDRAFALDWGLGGEIDRRLAEFRDYWTGVPGQRGVKLDWSGTWRNWVRRVGKPPTPLQATGPPSNVGWKPGMPTDAELRRKYAPQAGSLPQESPEPRGGEPVVVRESSRNGRVAQLGELLSGVDWANPRRDDPGGTGPNQAR